MPKLSDVFARLGNASSNNNSAKSPADKSRARRVSDHSDHQNSNRKAKLNQVIKQIKSVIN